MDNVKREFKKKPKGGASVEVAVDEPITASLSSALGSSQPITATVSTALRAAQPLLEPLKEIVKKVPMNHFRKYIRGWTPHFNVDDFFDQKPTIRFTGKGSAQNVPRKSGLPEPQTYDEIKAQCLDSGCLWEDPDFPAEAESIFYNNPPSVWPDVEWLRPSVSLHYKDGWDESGVNVPKSAYTSNEKGW